MLYQVRAIIPDEPAIDVEELLGAVNRGLDASATWVASDFEQTQSSWKEKAKFTTTTPENLRRVVETNNELYDWINNGTKPHQIPSSPGNKRLFFRYPFAPKTQKNVIGSFNGNRGNQVARPKQVVQSILAREFDETIAREWNKSERLGNMIQTEIDAVVTS